MKKNRSAEITHGNVRKLRSQSLGALKMRLIEAGERLNVAVLHEALPPYSSAPDVVHERTVELVYVSKGKARGYVNGERIDLRERDHLYIPAGTEHRFETRASAVEAISIFSPPLDMRRPDAKIVLKSKKTELRAEK